MDFQTTSFRARRFYVWTYFCRIRAADQEDHAMSVKNLIPPVLLLLLAFAAAPVAADTVRIYVTNAAGDSVHVVDPMTNKVVQVIKGIEAAHGINFSPDGARVYVSNEADNTLDVVDRKSGKFIKKVPLSGHPNNIAVTKDGGRVVVAIAEQVGALDFIDTASLSRAKTIPVNGRQHNVYVTPDGKYSISGSTRTGVISVVDLQSEQPAWELKLDAGVRPMTFEVGADGSTRRVFAQLSNFNGFAVVDFAARKEIEKIKLPDEPTGFGAQEQRLGSPSHGIGVAPDGKTLWVTSLSANAVFVYALPDLKLQGHVALPELKLKAFTQPLGALPNWVTFTPDSKLIYVSNSGIRSVSAIDTAAMKVVANIPVGEVPKRINTLVMR
jgi:YVTN family beta-propeller protein